MRAGTAEASGARPPASAKEQSAVWLCFALIPVFMALATWDPAGSRTPLQSNIRFFAAPALLFELFTIVAALGSGFRPLKAFREAARWQMIALLLLILIAWGSALITAPVTVAAVVRTSLSLLHLSFGLCAAYLLTNASLPIRRTIWRMIAAGICVYAAILVLYVAAVDWSGEFDWVYFGLGVMHIRLVGFYAAVGALAALGLAASSRSSLEFWAATAGVTLLVGIICWTGSRGALIAIVGSMAVGLTCIPSMRSRKTIVSVCLSLVAGAALSLPFAAPHSMYGLLRISEDMTGESINELSTGRSRMWMGTLQAVARQPFFGYGEDQFRSLIQEALGRFNHPHNVIFQMLLQWGIVGSICFFSLMAALWWSSLRAVRNESHSGTPAFLVLSGLLIFSLYDGTLYHVYPAMMVAFCCAFLLSGRGKIV